MMCTLSWGNALRFVNDNSELTLDKQSQVLCTLLMRHDNCLSMTAGCFSYTERIVVAQSV
eukprot:7613-Heterococcus_DN1.PRE.5